ncbi:hypothetical protein E4U42_002792, partial [Claviceps africana]
MSCRVGFSHIITSDPVTPCDEPDGQIRTRRVGDQPPRKDEERKPCLASPCPGLAACELSSSLTGLFASLPRPVPQPGRAQSCPIVIVIVIAVAIAIAIALALVLLSERMTSPGPGIAELVTPSRPVGLNRPSPNPK